MPMTISILFAAALAVQVTPLSAPDTHRQIPTERRVVADAVRTNAAALQTSPSPMDVLPTAGLSNKDFAIPFFVDLDDGPGIRDFNCGRLTFDTHTGHDPYIRSFR